MIYENENLIDTTSYNLVKANSMCGVIIINCRQF